MGYDSIKKISGDGKLTAGKVGIRFDSRRLHQDLIQYNPKKYKTR
jgi:hypothetical protein